MEGFSFVTPVTGLKLERKMMMLNIAELVLLL
jgi:hypothetical protein